MLYSAIYYIFNVNKDLFLFLLNEAVTQENIKQVLKITWSRKNVIVKTFTCLEINKECGNDDVYVRIKKQQILCLYWT